LYPSFFILEAVPHAGLPTWRCSCKPGAAPAQAGICARQPAQPQSAARLCLCHDEYFLYKNKRFLRSWPRFKHQSSAF
jgi:hypothetical protein